MVLGLGAEVLEDALLPVAFHLVPVVNHAVTDRVVDVVRLAVGEGLVADEKVEVLDTALRREVAAGRATGLGGDRRTAAAGRAAAAGCDAGRDDEGRVRVTGKAARMDASFESV